MIEWPTRLTEYLLGRAAGEPFFIASALAFYAEAHQLDLASVGGLLSVSGPELTKLSLCRLPDEESPDFVTDVRRVAEYSGANELQLLRVLRETAALRALRASSTADSGRGYLMAARDRQDATPDAADPHRREPKENE